MTDTTVRIVIADDHSTVRDALKRVLESEPRYRVVGEAKTGRDAIHVTRAHRPEVLLFDISMPALSRLEALNRITPDSPETKVIALTASIDRAAVLKALQHGARGVVLKTAGSDILFGAISAVLQGRQWLDRGSVSDLVQVVRELSGSAPQTRHPYGLTDRQMQIVGNVMRGLTNREIGSTLSISEETVKHHLTQIFNKTGVSTRLELALLATRRELVRSRDHARP
ncbi:MAG: DNA-binding response regulator [Acidobacteria bacterium]|nr:MAG: DNA-binding response regulator [Acidobacteriota bacterium]